MIDWKNMCLTQWNISCFNFYASVFRYVISKIFGSDLKYVTTEAYALEDLFYSVEFVLVEDEWASLKILFYFIWKATTGVKNVSHLLTLKSQTDELHEIFLLEVRPIFGFVKWRKVIRYIVEIVHIYF